MDTSTLQVIEETKIIFSDSDEGVITPKNNNNNIDDANTTNFINETVTMFTPHQFDTMIQGNYKTEDLMKLVEDALDEKLLARFYRIFGFLCFAIAGPILMGFTSDNFHVTKVLSLGIFGMIILYLIHLYWFVFTAKISHRIYSLSGVVPDWIRMPITYRQIMYKYQPITSISEFSAIGGGTANQMLIYISVCAWMIILVQELNNIWYEKTWLSYTKGIICNKCKRNVVDMFGGLDTVLVFIGTFGMVMIGIFDLDPFSNKLQRIHMLSVFLCLFCPVGFLVQQSKANHIGGIIVAILIGLITLLSAGLWKLYFNSKADKLGIKYYKNPPKNADEINVANKEVKSLTIKNIISESIVLFCGALSLCLWLWHFDNINPSFRESIGYLPFGGPHKQYYHYIVNKYECDNSSIIQLSDDSINYCQIY